jgi:hypothetical protein
MKRNKSRGSIKIKVDHAYDHLIIFMTRSTYENKALQMDRKSLRFCYFSKSVSYEMKDAIYSNRFFSMSKLPSPRSALSSRKSRITLDARTQLSDNKPHER